MGKVPVTSPGLLHDSSSSSWYFRAGYPSRWHTAGGRCSFVVHKGNPLGSLPPNSSRKARMPVASHTFTQSRWCFSHSSCAVAKVLNSRRFGFTKSHICRGTPSVAGTKTRTHA